MLQRTASAPGNTWDEAMTITMMVKGGYSIQEAKAIRSFMDKNAWMQWNGHYAFLKDASSANAINYPFAAQSLELLQNETQANVRDLVLEYHGKEIPSKSDDSQVTGSANSSWEKCDAKLQTPDASPAKERPSIYFLLCNAKRDSLEKIPVAILHVPNTCGKKVKKRC